MMKKSNILFYLILCSTTLTSAHALIISEIMYDPEGSDTDREWVEILNDTGDSVDLKAWKFFESNTNHGLTVTQGSTVLPSGGYAVIVDNATTFLQEYTSFSGTLLDSSFSLSNSGEYIALKDGSLGVKDSITYAPSLGGNDDGTTLSFLAGTWVRGNSTPGGANSISTEPLGDTTKVSTSTPSIAPSRISAALSPLTVIIPGDKIVVAGADSDFTARAVSGGGKVPENALFTWSFGDGGTRSGRSVMYHYQYPGVYIAVVEVEADGMIALGRMKVRVIDSNLSIAKVGSDIRGMYVDLANGSPLEVDISGWKLGVNGLNYILPKNTFLSAKQTVRVAGAALGVGSSSLTATSSVRLLYPNHEEVVRYIASTTELSITKAIAFVGTTSVVRTYAKAVGTQLVKTITTEKATSSTTTPEKREDTGGITGWFKKFFSRL